MHTANKVEESWQKEDDTDQCKLETPRKKRKEEKER